MSATTLLADIGGTNARFALLNDDVISTPAILATPDLTTLTQALSNSRFSQPCAIAHWFPQRGDTLEGFIREQARSHIRPSLLPW